MSRHTFRCPPPPAPPCHGGTAGTGDTGDTSYQASKNFPSDEHFLRRLVGARDWLLVSSFEMHVSLYVCTRSESNSESNKTTNQNHTRPGLATKSEKCACGHRALASILEHTSVHGVTCDLCPCALLRDKLSKCPSQFFSLFPWLCSCACASWIPVRACC